MPPKRPVAGKSASEVPPDNPGPVKGGKRAARPVPRAKGKGKRAHKMPPPLPAGELLQDFHKRKWVLGPSVGKGGFGEIYLAGPHGTKLNPDTAEHVIKIEPHENGPLFTELSFYTRIAKPERLHGWVRDHELRFLAIPEFIGAGSHFHDGREYRFMVMQRFGMDMEKLFTSAGRRFGIKTVCYLALRLLEALEFLHASEYVHADIKGSNLLTGHLHGNKHEVYLVDYGLAYRFCPEGKHKDYKEDPRRAHDGTIEFTSIDAHNGVWPSRRGDLEILGYCLLQWACGRLPWEDRLADQPYVAREKIRYRSDVAGLMRACFTSGEPAPTCLRQYMGCVYSLGYQEQPDYTRLKQLFLTELKSRKMKDDMKGLDWLPSRKRKSGTISPGSSDVEEQDNPVISRPARRKKAAREANPSASPATKRSGRKPRPSAKEKADVLSDPDQEEPHVRQKKVVSKRRRHKPAREEEDGGPPMATRHSPRQIIPKASYPPELGYSNGEVLSSRPNRAKKTAGARQRPQAGAQRRPREKVAAEEEAVPGTHHRAIESDSDDDYMPSPAKRSRKTREKATERIVISD